MTNPFEHAANQDAIAVTFADGRIEEGVYMPMAGFHFLSVTAPGTLLGSKIVGPLVDIASIAIIATREQRFQDRVRKSRGAPHPGRAPKTADDYRYRLETLARAVTREPDTRRRDELLYQFEDVAEQIELSKAKRSWMLKAAHFALTHNEDPVLADLWDAPIASPSFIRRPRDQDFDPDARVRRARFMPAHVANDPRSIPNMLAAFRRAEMKASIIRLGDPEHDHGVIEVHLGGPKARFAATGQRQPDGKMKWTMGWSGNTNRSTLRWYRNAMASENYTVMRSIVRPNVLLDETGLFL